MGAEVELFSGEELISFSPANATKNPIPLKAANCNIVRRVVLGGGGGGVGKLLNKIKFSLFFKVGK